MPTTTKLVITNQWPAATMNRRLLAFINLWKIISAHFTLCEIIARSLDIESKFEIVSFSDIQLHAGSPPK